MANVNDRAALPELASDRELAPQIYYDSYTDTLVVSLYGPPEAGMNVPVDDAGIDLRVSLDERELLGFEIPGFTSSFLPLHPQYLDFAASAAVGRFAFPERSSYGDGHWLLHYSGSDTMDDKKRENRLRRLAERQGLALRKSRRKGSQAPDYGKYQIVNPGNNTVVAGDQPHEYSLSLDEVEQWLTNDEVTPQASVESSPYRARRASRDSDPRTRQGDRPDGRRE